MNNSKMFMKHIILLATVFAIICATKEQSTNSGYTQSGEHTIHNQHTIYGQPMQDNIASETELAKRASASTTSGSSNPESQGQTSQIDVGSGGSGNGVIGYGTPNSYQQFYSPAFGQFGGTLFAATAAPSSSSSTSGATPQIFYVRAPAQYVAPSGIGTIKLTYTGESSQPTTSIQYAATAPKFAYNFPSNPYQFAYATQPNPYTYAPLSLASPYTANGYASSNIYGNGQITAASLQQGQLIPYTTATNGLYLSPSNLQQFGFSLTPQSLSQTSATVQPFTAYTMATPNIPNVSKYGSNIVTPTASAFYSAAPASQTYQQSPSFLSYANAASPFNYRSGRNFSYPLYPRDFRSAIAPTIFTTSPYAYVQPTGSSPVKYSLTQPLSNNYASSSSSASASSAAYNQNLYAPSSITATPSPYTSAVQQQSLNQAIAAQSSNTNGAIQYAQQQLYPSAQQLTANKYAYSQLAATPQKYFYASS